MVSTAGSGLRRAGVPAMLPLHKPMSGALIKEDLFWAVCSGSSGLNRKEGGNLQINTDKITNRIDLGATNDKACVFLFVFLFSPSSSSSWYTL